MSTVVLFTQKKSIYNSLGCDCYDEKRNALNYMGSEPVIAHPPCRLFSRMRGLSTAKMSEKDLAYWAVDLIRKNGGVLEHPYLSKLWSEKNIIMPGQGVDEYGGFSLDVNQVWFGHKAIKRTWLYIVGIDPGSIPDYNFLGMPTHMVSHLKRHKNPRKSLGKEEASYTPVDFARYLIECIEIIKANKAKQLQTNNF